MKSGNATKPTPPRYWGALPPCTPTAQLRNLRNAAAVSGLGC